MKTQFCSLSVMLQATEMHFGFPFQISIVMLTKSANETNKKNFTRQCHFQQFTEIQICIIVWNLLIFC